MFLNSLMYYVPTWMRHTLMMDEIDDQTLEFRLTDINLKLNFDETRLTTLWWTLLNFESFELTGLNVTAIARVSGDDDWRIDEFSSVTFDSIDLQLGDEGIVMLQMIVDGVIPVINYFGNFVIEEFVLPTFMQSEQRCMFDDLCGYVWESKYGVEAGAPFAGFNFLRPTLDKELDLFQIGVEKKDLPTTNAILPGFEPNNHTFQMYFSEAMVADKLLGQPWAFTHGEKLWF